MASIMLRGLPGPLVDRLRAYARTEGLSLRDAAVDILAAGLAQSADDELRGRLDPEMARVRFPGGTDDPR